ncbi:hypothetical protein MTR67_036639 [Solanum verrucosum]|uniref:Uncharacterized protein n=1 Tax=Solanum verrucosum TaxID=315347 RepID=A0AAF0UCD9_SOLVR|nr:hypothetical protein MTR67_036639 [Solanum verrucosum]
MAEAFLQILLENITSFIQGELGLLLDFEKTIFFYTPKIGEHKYYLKLNYMAEAFQKAVLDNLSSFLKGELVLHFNFQNEFQRLSSMFSTIQVVLEKQDARQEASIHQSSQMF